MVKRTEFDCQLAGLTVAVSNVDTASDAVNIPLPPLALPSEHKFDSAEGEVSMEYDSVVLAARCPRQDFWDALYADGSAQQSFYQEVHGDENCTVTHWEHGRRVVSAKLPLHLPTFAKAIIGGAAEYSLLSNGNTFSQL
jgi:hypothetical protein